MLFWKASRKLFFLGGGLSEGKGVGGETSGEMGACRWFSAGTGRVASRAAS